MKIIITGCLAGLLFLLVVPQVLCAQGSFVRVESGRFFKNGHPYYFIGANYWYGGLIGISETGQGKNKTGTGFPERQWSK